VSIGDLNAFPDGRLATGRLAASRVRARESYARAARLPRRRRGSEGGQAPTMERRESRTAVGVAE